MKYLLLCSLLSVGLLGRTSALGAEKMDPKVWGGINITVLDSGLSSPPQAVKTVNPRFPTSIKGHQAHYLVVLEFTVDKDGKVRNLHEVGFQDKHYVEVAEDAINQWEFEPGTKNGEKVDTHIHVTVPFKSVTRETRPTADWK